MADRLEDKRSIKKSMKTRYLNKYKKELDTLPALC